MVSLFGEKHTSHLLEEMNFLALPALTHVSAKMAHRSGPAAQLWHHGVYCGNGKHLVSLSARHKIDMSSYFVPVGAQRIPLAEFLETNHDTPLICEYDGPTANGQVASQACFKGRVTFNACSTWQKLYRIVHYKRYKKHSQSEEKILRSIFDSLGRENYSLLFSNCEHHTTGVLHGKEVSGQANAGMLSAAMVVGGIVAGGLAMYAALKKDDEEEAPALRRRGLVDENESDSDAER